MPEGGWVTSPKCRLHGEKPDELGADEREPALETAHPMEQDVVTPTRPERETVGQRVSLLTMDDEVKVLDLVVEAMRDLTRTQQRRLAAYIINRYGVGEA